MAKKKLTQTISEPAPEMIDLSQWLTIEEAVALRKEVGRPLSSQRIYGVSDAGRIATRRIKTVRVFSRADVLAYQGKRGRPSPKE